MTTKQEAIQWIKEIQNGDGLDRSEASAKMPFKGAMAERYWNDGLFTYGMEYGVMFALMKVFDIKAEDIV